MDVSRVKFNLGRQVSFRGAVYTLNACIIRQGGKGFRFQAELEDINAKSSLVIADLKEIQEKHA